MTRSLCKTLFRAVRFEWELLAQKRAVLLLAAGYALLVLGACLSEDLRQSYCTAIESLPLFFLELAAPVFLAVSLTAALAPVFAAEEEEGTGLIPAACRLGPRGWSLSRLLAALGFSAGLCLTYALISLALPWMFGLYDPALPVREIGGELSLSPVWPAGRHLLFAALSLGFGCEALSMVLLAVSRRSGTRLSAAGCAGILLVLEWLFHQFSFPWPVRECNLWKLLTPYEFFAPGLLHGFPVMRLLLFCAALLPLCCRLGRRILQRKT